VYTREPSFGRPEGGQTDDIREESFGKRLFYLLGAEGRGERPLPPLPARESKKKAKNQLLLPSSFLRFASKTQKERQREREKKKTYTHTHTHTNNVVEARVETTRRETPKPARRVRPREKRAVPRENRAVREQRQRGRREQNETKMVPERETEAVVFGGFGPDGFGASYRARVEVHR